jgi:hypothetical protein
MNRYFTPFLFSIITITLPATATTNPPEDSVRKKHQVSTLRLTTRAHSSGFFYFGGKLAEYNPAFDFNINLETPTFGYTFFKATDLTNIHSSFNFALAAIYKNFAVKKFKYTPQVLVLIEQPHRIVDEGSDVGFTFTTSYKISNSLTVEHTVIFFNLIFETAYMDVINRMRVLYSKNHMDFTLMGWHNNGVLDSEHHLTAAISAAYNRIKISNHLNIGAGVMASATGYSSDIGTVPERKGITFTVSATIQ